MYTFELNVRWMCLHTCHPSMQSNFHRVTYISFFNHCQTKGPAWYALIRVSMTIWLCGKVGVIKQTKELLEYVAHLVLFYLHHLHHSTFGSECALWWSLVDRHLHCIVDVVIDSSISIILIIMIPTSSFAFKSLARDAIPGTVTDRQTDRQSASKSAFNIVVLEYIEVSAG